MEPHARLSADTHVLGDLPEGRLLLHRNASVPWLILVPPGDATQLHELPVLMRTAVHERIDALSAFVQQHFACERVNVASIGNLVPQLHVHVVGRSPGDPAWPGVVWGAPLPDVGWSEQARTDLVRALVERFELNPA